MKYVLMFCDTPERYGEVDEVAAKAVHEEIWAWFGEHDAAGRIADMGAHLQPVTTANETLVFALPREIRPARRSS